MNFRYIFLMALMGASSALAMDYVGQDHTQPRSRAAARLHAVEQHAHAKHLVASAAVKHAAYQERNSEKAKILGDAFGKLDKNGVLSEQARRAFYKKIEQKMPDEIMEHIAGFNAKEKRPRLVPAQLIESNIQKLIPCILSCKALYPSMKKIVSIVERQLTKAHENYQLLLAQHILPANRNQQEGEPYIVAASGFWGFGDESSKFRYKEGPMNPPMDERTDDLMAWFRLRYDQNIRVNPMANDEFVGVVYSNGVIKWVLNPFNSAQLKRIRFEHFELGITLWQEPEFLKNDECGVYDSLPAHIRQSVRSNYEIAASKSSRYVKTGLSILRFAGAVGLGALYARYWKPGAYILKDPRLSDPSYASILFAIVLHNLPPIIAGKIIKKKLVGRDTLDISNISVLFNLGLYATRMREGNLLAASLSAFYDAYILSLFI